MERTDPPVQSYFFIESDESERTVATLIQRFAVDEEHAGRIRDTALILYGQVAQPWELMDPSHPIMLTWAARLPEDRA